MTRRVLIVEDDAMIAMLIEELIGQLACKVAGFASSAAEARRMAREVDFDVALLDINLGHGETSFEAADIIRDRDLPFAFLTGYDLKAVRPDLRDRTIMQKPIDFEELRRFLVSV